MARFARLMPWLAADDQRGSTMIEVLIALIIFGVIAVAFLGGVASGSRATSISNDQAIAESLVRSQAEYVKGLAYVYDASSYPVDPALTIPASWSLPAPAAEPAGGGSDVGIQEITVSAVRNGDTILSIVIYKVDR